VKDEEIKSLGEQDDTFSSSEKLHTKSNFSKYVDLYRRLLLLNEKDNPATTVKNIQDLLSFSKKIFSSSSIGEAFLYFCLHGAATALILQTELNIPEASVYRAIKRLRAMGIIVPAIKPSRIRRSRGGPRATIWALECASTEEISKALELHFRCSAQSIGLHGRLLRPYSANM
jgi:predicted transcriptional regulator